MSKVGIGHVTGGELLLLCLFSCSSEPGQGAGATGGSASAQKSGATATGTSGSGGSAGTGASGRGVRGAGNSGAGSVGAEGGTSGAALAQFSFFVSSLNAMRELSASQNGFGGDLRFGETGDGAGLRGADKICATIAEKSLPGSGSKGWRAFLSATAGGVSNGPVHAIDRVGEGPWYDRLGRLVAMTKSDLLQVRPATADAAIQNDLPNEDGVPNHNPDSTGEVDNHDVLTGTNDKGQLFANDPRVTCDDWTKSDADANDAPRVGHSWPRTMGPGGGPGGGPGFGGMGVPPGGFFGGFGGRGGPGGGMISPENWMSALDEAGCGPSVGIVEMGGPMENDPTVGSGGGYGGIYCFALMP